MKSSLKDFVDKVFSVNPMFGGGPSVSRTSNSAFGRSAIQILNELRQSTAQFGEKITAKAPSTEVDVLARSIEGNLLNLQVLGAISEDLTNDLLERLFTIHSR